MTKEVSNGITRFHASRGLQFVLAASFFAVLLFLINSAVGAVWLATHNLPGEAFIFVMMAGLAGIMVLFAIIFLFFVSHSNVALGPEVAQLTLPNWRGPTPMLPYIDITVPYEQIGAVETRGEVYRYLALPVIVRAFSLVRKDGRRLTLGYVRENPQDPPMPFHDIAAEIAQRAGVTVRDVGVVDAGSNFRAMLQDEPRWDAPGIAPERLIAQRSKASFAWRALLSLLVVVVIAAIVYQLSLLF